MSMSLYSLLGFVEDLNEALNVLLEIPSSSTDRVTSLDGGVVISDVIPSTLPSLHKLILFRRHTKQVNVPLCPEIILTSADNECVRQGKI